MNIQFRKIYLSLLPEVNARALIELARGDSNNALQSPSLPIGVYKSKSVSRSNLNEIIQDLENGNTEKITVLEWVHCIYNKGKWDTKNIDRSISTSEKIWKAAEQNTWLKQQLFWNLVLDLELGNVLASSLAISYGVFCPQDFVDIGRLVIIKILKAKHPINDFIKLCWSELLTTSEILVKYQLPTRISLAQAAYDYVVPQLSTSDNINYQQIKWLLKCLEQMSREQQTRAVEYLLTQVNQHIGAEYPELINWLRQYYGSAEANSRWNELSSEAKSAMRKWLGAVSYQDFQKLVSLILDRVPLEDYEYRRLKSRSGFWSNYSDRFERIRILLPQSSVSILGSYLNHQDVEVLQEDGSDPTEICIFDFRDWFLVEFFRGNGSETRIFKKYAETEQQLFNSKLSIKKLRCLGLNNPIHDHVICWQYFCEQWLRDKSILPNKGTERFKGLHYKYNQYNFQTGLPKPTYENQRKRDRSLEYWKRDIAKLEREAKILYGELNA